MGRKKSKWWEYVEDLKNNHFGCKFCEKEFSGGASRILAHLARENGHDIAICDKVLPGVQAQAFNEIHGPNKKPKSTAPSSNNVEEYGIISLQSFPEDAHISSTLSNIDVLPTTALAKQTTDIRNMEEGPSMVTSYPIIRPYRTTDYSPVGEQVTHHKGRSSNGDILPTTTLAGEGARRNMEKIWACLINDGVRKIGVHGMVGVGKTTVMKHINNRLLKEPNKFENVIWVSVSNASNVIELQNEIACKLDLDLSKFKDEITRSAKLYAALEKTKKYVLILDNMWETVTLEHIGIPEPTIESGCKLVLTTPCLDVCRKMEFKKIRVKLLTEDEAWELFYDIVGRDLLNTQGLKAIMNEVLDKCHCLPLAIVTVAGSLKGEANDYVWRTTLEELRESQSNNKWSTVFEKLKLSYTRLKDEKRQHCFLYCALYPEDYEIQRDDLIKNLIDEGIIQGMKSRQAKFDKGYTMLNDLENACLLERCRDRMGNKCVKMQGIVRDMVLQIASASHGFMVAANERLEDLRDEENWKVDLVRVSLMGCGFTNISCNALPRCPKLSTLMLNDNKSLESIPNSFLVHMPGLKVLNLSYTNIEYMPDSVVSLKNLTALVLIRCEKLKHVNSLEKLITLRRLELAHTRIEEIPQGLEMLVNLRHLNLYSKTLNIFPSGILPKLSHLQHFEFYWNLNLEVEEMASLKKLETIKCQFNDTDAFSTCVRLLKKVSPTNYVLKLGSNIEDVSIEGKAVILEDFSIVREKDSLVLPEDADFLKLSQIGELRSLCDLSSLCDLPSYFHPKKLCIQCCHRIVSLFDVHSSWAPHLGNPFQPNNEGLDTTTSFQLQSRLLSLQRIFSELQRLEIYCCYSIKVVFTPGLLLHLHNLEEFEVNECFELVEIIGASSEEAINMSLPKLRVLKLEYLPSLESICSSSQLMVCDSIQKIQIFKCLKVKKLPLSLPLRKGQLCPPPSLYKIEAEEEWWESLEWDHPNHPNSKTILQSFFVEKSTQETSDDDSYTCSGD